MCLTVRHIPMPRSRIKLPLRKSVCGGTWYRRTKSKRPMPAGSRPKTCLTVRQVLRSRSRLPQCQRRKCVKAIFKAGSASRRQRTAPISRSPTGREMISRLFRKGVRLYGKSRSKTPRGIADHARTESKSRGSVNGRCPVILPRQEHRKRRSSRSMGADTPATRRSRRSRQALQKARQRPGMSLSRSSARPLQRPSVQAPTI